jgi:hypothetical protein
MFCLSKVQTAIVGTIQPPNVRTNLIKCSFGSVPPENSEEYRKEINSLVFIKMRRKICFKVQESQREENI